MTSSKDDKLRLAAGLSPAMASALDRLCRSMVWADGRSVRALIKRGLAGTSGSVTDAMLGSFNIDYPTPLGREVNALRASEGDNNASR